jgi:hypothetical protein
MIKHKHPPQVNQGIACENGIPLEETSLQRQRAIRALCQAE